MLSTEAREHFHCQPGGVPECRLSGPGTLLNVLGCDHGVVFGTLAYLAFGWVGLSAAQPCPCTTLNNRQTRHHSPLNSLIQ